jgi:hypothetical protein
MTASVRVFTLIAAYLLLGAGIAASAPADIPEPYNFIVPAYIDVVGSRDGIADAHGQFTVTARDLAGNPLVGMEIKVVINCPDIRICTAPVAPGQTNSCLQPGGSATATTDANGVATFIICGAATNTGGSAIGCGALGASICGDFEPQYGWVLVSRATVAVYDQDGAATNAGLEVTDISAWLGDLGKIATNGYKGRSDYSHNGMLDVVDFSLLLKALGQGNSRQGSAGTYCP